MKAVTAYKTSDNEIHQSPLLALKHEHQIEIRSFFATHGGRADTYHVATLAKLMQEKGTELEKLFRRHNQDMNRLVNREKRKSQIVVKLIPAK